MTKRLSLADLKAKATASVIQNTEIYMGGEESGCHYNIVKKPAEMERDGTAIIHR
ncbi:MAG: hypothetical protein RLZZ628_2647 [Bacteroidota bacterium]|jgi:hypothetical protein